MQAFFHALKWNANYNSGVRPEVAAGVNDPVADGSVPQFLLLQRVLVAEQFHGQLVVGCLEERVSNFVELTFRVRVPVTRSVTRRRVA